MESQQTCSDPAVKALSTAGSIVSNWEQVSMCGFGSLQKCILVEINIHLKVLDDELHGNLPINQGFSYFLLPRCPNGESPNLISLSKVFFTVSSRN